MRKLKVSILLKIIFVMMVFAVSSVASAVETTQTTMTTTTTTSTKEPKKQKLSFEDELIEGGAQKPELFYLLQQKNFNYKRLIKLRENFLPEMRRTAEDIQRIRGGR